MSETVAAISTPQSAGGIGIIRISGDDAIAVADKAFHAKSGKKLKELKGYQAAFGEVYDETGKIDQCVALVFRAPKSYTGEDVVELSCHGGLYVLKRVLRAVLAAGACAAPAGEFTKRAYLNGKIDLTEAEAVMDLISAQGEMGAKAALTALDGALSRKMEEINGTLLYLSATMAAWVDYPDDETPELEAGQLISTLKDAERELLRLLSGFDAGAAVISGVETAIIGKPNVGKSALMNLLSGFSRSIVTDIAGTTRDTVEQTVSLGSLLLHLADTAGIHKTADVVESIGVDRAKQKLQRAGLIFAVFDLSRPFEGADEEIISLCKGKRAIAVFNKSDMPKKLDTEKITAAIPNSVNLCALHGQGIENLEKAAEKLLCTNDLDTSAAMLTTERQRKSAAQAKASIEEAIVCLETGITMDAVNVLIDDAIDSLLELTGQKVCDAVVNEVFSRFCVGK